MNLTITILDFGVRLYGGSELSNHLSKSLPRMRLIHIINVRTFRMKILVSVCNDLNNEQYIFLYYLFELFVHVSSKCII